MGRSELEVNQTTSSAGQTPSVLVHQSLLDDRIRAATASLGSCNTLVTCLLEAKAVCALLDELSTGEQRVEAVASLAGQLFSTRVVTSILDQPDPPEDSHLYMFDYADYQLHYGSCWENAVGTVEHSPLSLRGHSDPFQKFIYVIGAQEEWRHFSVPQPLSVTLAGRRDPIEFPFHPFLSRDIGHTVIAAGEFSVLWSETDEAPDLVYINNLSGHFRPKNLRARQLLEMARRNFGCSHRSIILSVCNDGACLDHRDI